MNILFLANEIRYTCGVTNHLLYLTRGLSSLNNIKLFLICGGGDGQERFRDIDIEILTDKRFLHGKRDIYNYFNAIIFLKSFVKKNKINIIHSHSHYGANIAAAAKKNQIRTIQTNHGILEYHGKLKHFSADKFIAINEHIYDYLLKNKIAPRGRIAFIRCGINIPFKPDKKTLSPIRILAASRFTRKKGLEIYIESVSNIKKGLKKNAEFLIAGEGELNDELRTLNEQLNAGIKFLGRVIDMDRLLSSTHIFVHPANSNTEGFPAVISEAGAHNNILISSDFRGIDSIVRNYENGFLFRINSVSELTGILENLLGNYSEYKPIALNLYEKIKVEFDLEKMIQKHLKLYKECLQT